MKRYFFAVLLLWVGVSIISRAQPAPAGFNSGSPEDAGMSSLRLEMAGELIDRYIEEGKLPGGVFIVARYGPIVLI